jgi:hypothetical protein
MAASFNGHLDSTKSADTAGGIGSIPLTATQGIFTVEDNSIRWRADGTAPTADIGVRQDVGDKILFVGNDYHDAMVNFSYINLTAGSNGSIQAHFSVGFDRA